MKQLIALFVIAILLSAVGFVKAAPRYPKKGGQSGLTGTVEDVGSQGFTMTTTDGKTYKVLCNANTKVVSGKSDPATLSDIKTGSHVNIQGGLLKADEIMANSVSIQPTASAPKKKKT